MIAALRIVDLVYGTPAGELVVSSTVDAGELGAVVAPPPVSSALARVVAGLAAPRSGQIFVGQRDVTRMPPARRQIGYVPSGGALLPHLTVQSNIEYGLRHRDFVHEVASDWVSRVIRCLELVPLLDLLPHQLSRAQRLRVALARAAAWLPEVLLLDLPTSIGGADRLRELASRVSPSDGPGVAMLVCSADADVLAEISNQVRPGIVGRERPREVTRG